METEQKTKIEFRWVDEKCVFCKNGVYFALTREEFDLMFEAMNRAIET